MATISNTPRPGYVWDSTDNVWYPIGVGAHQHTNAADTPAVIPYSTYAAAGKNKIINGDFNIWQRGTSFSSIAASAYGPDRWTFGTVGDVVNVTRQAFTPNDITAIGYGDAQYFMRMEVVSSNGSARVEQKIENVTTFANQTVTVSLWAKGSTTTSLDLLFLQNFGSGGSSQITLDSQAVTLTTSWQRFSKTFTIPSVSGKTIGTGSYLALALRETTASTNVTFDIWGVQVEAGSTATAFQTATGNPASELAACQRYYEQSAPAGTVLVDGMSGTTNSVASAYSGSDMRTQRFDFKVTKRATPTMTYYRSNDGSTAGRWVYYVSGWTTPTGQSNSLLTQDSFAVYMTGSFTTRDCYIIEGGGWSASAEL